MYSKHKIYHDTRRENNQQLIWLFVILSLLYIKTSMQLPVYHRHNIYTTSFEVKYSIHVIYAITVYKILYTREPLAHVYRRVESSCHTTTTCLLRSSNSILSHLGSCQELVMIIMRMFFSPRANSTNKPTARIAFLL